MGKVFSGSIVGKEIVNIDGAVLGELHLRSHLYADPTSWWQVDCARPVL